MLRSHVRLQHSVRLEAKQMMSDNRNLYCTMNMLRCQSQHVVFLGGPPKNKDTQKTHLDQDKIWNNDMSVMLERGYQKTKILEISHYTLLQFTSRMKKQFEIHIVHLLLPCMTFPFMNKHAKYKIIGKSLP